MMSRAALPALGSSGQGLGDARSRERASPVSGPTRVGAGSRRAVGVDPQQVERLLPRHLVGVHEDTHRDASVETLGEGKAIHLVRRPYRVKSQGTTSAKLTTTEKSHF